MTDPYYDADRAAARDDLVDLALFESFLSPSGIEGILVDCGCCEEDHAYTWEQLRDNLLALLSGKQAAIPPRVDNTGVTFVSWDFCMGFVAGVGQERDRGNQQQQ